MSNDVISINKLKNLCLEYDKSYGHYPEHTYEGLSVLNYILNRLSINERYKANGEDKDSKGHSYWYNSKWDDETMLKYILVE